MVWQENFNWCISNAVSLQYKLWEWPIWDCHLFTYQCLFCISHSSCTFGLYLCEIWFICLPVSLFPLFFTRYPILWLRIALELNMGQPSGMRHWINISNGFFNIESAPIFANGLMVCVFWHTRVHGQVYFWGNRFDRVATSRNNSIAEYFPFVIVADHPKSDEYFSDPRLAAYAVPYKQVVSGYTVSCPRSLLSGIFGMRTDEIQPTCWCATVMMRRRITCRNKLRYWEPRTTGEKLTFTCGMRYKHAG